MSILIGCEESQTITAKFRYRGFEAYSCDLMPTRGDPQYHYQADVMSIIPTREWSLIILHPDCTAMALCGNAHYGKGMPKHDQRIAAIEWTVALWELAKQHSERVVLENPMSVIFTYLEGGETQYVQPYQFGHTEQKKTGFHRVGLPALKPTKDVYDEMMLLPRKKRERIHFMSPSDTRARDRSVTFSGIADAIVDQYGDVLIMADILR